MKKIILSALALMGVCATAQEKVKVHNGSDSYVTIIEYVTFDATDADEAVSVANLKSANQTLAGQISTLEGQVSTLTSEKNTLADEKAALESEKAKITEQSKATCAFGHDFVDLGLPSKTLWATTNVGAESPEEYGDYFAWGETSPYYLAGGHTHNATWKEGYAAGYSWSSYFDTNDNGKTLKKYKKYSGKTELDVVDDAAAQIWGGRWRMPNNEMLDELHSQCCWVWTSSYNGKSVKGFIVYKAKSDADKGVKITSGQTASADYNVADDVHIFLPTSGYRMNNTYYVDYYLSSDIYGNYWSRTINNENVFEAYCFNFCSSLIRWDPRDRCLGNTVRPVVPAVK